MKGAKTKIKRLWLYMDCMQKVGEDVMESELADWIWQFSHVYCVIENWNSCEHVWWCDFVAMREI